MEFYLNLTIRGLCALVPMEPLTYGEQKKISKMKVLVLDAQEPRTITKQAEKPLHICRHIPELRLPDDVWPLTCHCIKIDGLNYSYPLQIEPSFGRIAQIELAAPGSGRIQKRFLDQDPPEGLVATLDLTSGTVEALAPRREEMVFQPELVNPPYCGHFASMVHVQMVARDEVVLSAEPVGGKGKTYKEHLRPKPGHDSVEIFLTNLCPPSSHSGGGDEETDFAAFYDLSEGYEKSISIPKESGRPSGDRGTVRGEASLSPACIVGGFPGQGDQ